MERTFIMVKPDGVQRGLVGEVMCRLERRGFKLVAIKFLKAEQGLLRKHYQDLKDKPFFESYVNYMASGPVCAMVWEGKDVVTMGRIMLGETDPKKSKPGTIRGDYSIEIGRNICHGSDSVRTAEIEIPLWFKKEELVEWKDHSVQWIYE